MKVAFVHDDLVQWGGAERLLLGMMELFPDAPVFTSVFDYENQTLQEKFKDKKINTSFMQQLPGWKSLYKAYLPLYPIAFEQFDFTGYDLVISSTTRFAKSIITKPETIHVCYCNTPPRFLWNFSGERYPKILSPLLSYLRYFDYISATRVDFWIANSRNVQSRLKKVYGVNSEVLHPFVDTSEFSQVKTSNQGYYLVMARLNAYKRVDIAVDAFNQLGNELIVVGKGPELVSLRQKAKDTIQFYEFISDEKRVELVAGCKALIVTAEEDFGMTPIEAQSVGKPVIAFGAGGALETVIDGKTGVFFKEQNTSSLIDAVKRLDLIKINPTVCIENAENFSKHNFQKKMLSLLKTMQNYYNKETSLVR